MPDPAFNTLRRNDWIRKGAEKQIAANSARQRLNLQEATRIGRSTKALIHPAETINSQSTIELYARLLKQQLKKEIDDL